MLLGVNIDHIATLRQARYAGIHQAFNAEPSPLQAALDALEGGADSITIHVRGDRRHMQDSDAYEIREQVNAPLNLEMGITNPHFPAPPARPNGSFRGLPQKANSLQ